jgi:hypothetical protein
MRSSALVWIQQGRWGAYLFENWILPNPAIPFVSSFMFGVFMALAYSMLLRANGVRVIGFLHFLTYPIFVAFPVWIFLAAFSANFAAAGFAMMLACFSAKLYRDFLDLCGDGRKFPAFQKLVLATLFCGFSVGIYQSYIFVVAVLVAGVLLIYMLISTQK